MLNEKPPNLSEVKTIQKRKKVHLENLHFYMSKNLPVPKSKANTNLYD